MLPYVFAIGAAVFFAYLGQRTKSMVTTNARINVPGDFFLGASFLTLFLFVGLRVDVGKDYPTYVQLFNSIAQGQKTFFEPGFKYLNSSIAYLTNNPQWLFIACSFLMFAFVFMSVRKYSRNMALSIFLFCSMSFLFYSLNATRQFIAIAIMLFAWKHLVNRNFTTYALTTLGASLFHKTALIMLPMYWILNYKYKKSHYLIILVLSYFSSSFKVTVVNILLNIYPQYGGSALISEQVGKSELFVLTSLILLLLLVFLGRRKKIDMGNPEDRISVNIIFFMAIVHTLLSWVPAIDRLALYLDIYLILIIPYLISKFEHKITRGLLVTGFIVYTSIYTYVSVGLNDSHNVLPYNSVITHTERSGK